MNDQDDDKKQLIKLYGGINTGIGICFMVVTLYVMIKTILRI